MSPEAFERLLDYMDAIRKQAETAARPVYAETCICGGSVEVGREATAAERRRIHATFVGRHHGCTPVPQTKEAGR